jgi:hypothetical protein
MKKAAAEIRPPSRMCTRPSRWAGGSGGYVMGNERGDVTGACRRSQGHARSEMRLDNPANESLGHGAPRHETAAHPADTPRAQPFLSVIL